MKKYWGLGSQRRWRRARHACHVIFYRVFIPAQGPADNVRQGRRWLVRSRGGRVASRWDATVAPHQNFTTWPRKKCHANIESQIVPSDPNQLLGQRGRARGVSQHLQPGCAKGVTCFSTAVAQHSFSLVVPLCWATLGQHPCSPPS